MPANRKIVGWFYIMGVLDRIFRFRKVQADDNRQGSEENMVRNENCIKLMEFSTAMECLLQEDRYLAKSDYQKLLEVYVATIDFFTVLEESGMLQNYCIVNAITERQVRGKIDYTKTQKSMSKSIMKILSVVQWVRKKNILIIFSKLLIQPWFLMKTKEELFLPMRTIVL